MALTNLFGEVATETTLADVYNLLAYYLDRMEFGINTDKGKRLNVNADLSASGTLGTVTTVTGVTTVATLTDQTYIGGLQAKRTVEAQLDTAYNAGFLSHITF